MGNHTITQCILTLSHTHKSSFLEHSHLVFLNYFILPSQKLIYLLYNTNLQHTQHLNFYIPIQHIKIIYLYNNIYIYIYIYICNNNIFLSSNFCLSVCLSLCLSLSLSAVNKLKTLHNHHQNLTTPPLLHPQQKLAKAPLAKSWQKPKQPPQQITSSQQIHSNHSNQHNLQNYNNSIATTTP